MEKCCEKRFFQKKNIAISSNNSMNIGQLDMIIGFVGKGVLMSMNKLDWESYAFKFMPMYELRYVASLSFLFMHSYKKRFNDKM